jgi:ElaB/YqjD/DUF883 family membrane-anchored ribosome-binding protein
MAEEQSGEMTERDATDLVPTDETDDERALRIRESMIESRQQIADSLDQIRVEVRDAVEWRDWVDEHPVEAVGIAFGVGFMLGFR